MNRLIKVVAVVGSIVILNACALAPGLKYQVEPLPIPILIVPDDGASNNQPNNPNAYPNGDQNMPYQGNNQPQPYSDPRQQERWRNRNNGY